jgi:hypothetical protein
MFTSENLLLLCVQGQGFARAGVNTQYFRPTPQDNKIATVAAPLSHSRTRTIGIHSVGGSVGNVRGDLTAQGKGEGPGSIYRSIKILQSSTDEGKVSCYPVLARLCLISVESKAVVSLQRGPAPPSFASA